MEVVDAYEMDREALNAWYERNVGYRPDDDNGAELPLEELREMVSEFIAEVLCNEQQRPVSAGRGLMIAGLAPMGTDFHLRHGTGANAPADMVWNSLRDGFDEDGADDVSGYCIDAPERIPAGAAFGGVAGRALVATWLRAR